MYAAGWSGGGAGDSAFAEVGSRVRVVAVEGIILTVEPDEG